MSKKPSEMVNPTHQLCGDHKLILDLFKEQSPDTGFGPAVHRLFGGNAERTRSVRIGNRWFNHVAIAKNIVSFLPEQWQEELKKTKDTWSGCENWWAGYPLIIWVELQISNDRGATGYLKLNAEVGPVSNHVARKGMIEAIKVSASRAALERIQFPPGASDHGRLYSRFLQKNSIAINNIRNTEEVERGLVQLISDFEPELELVAGTIPRFSSFSAL